MPRFRGIHIAAAAAAAEAADDMSRACRKTALQSSHNDDASQASGDSSIVELQSLQGEENEESGSQVSVSDAGSEASADEEEAERRAVDDDPEQQAVYRRIYRPEASRPGEEVGSNEASSSSCRFSIGDIIRPIYRLADLRSYKCGAICQVVEVDFEGDPIVSYFEPCGALDKDSRLHYAEHFEQICRAVFFEEHPHISHSTWESVLNASRQCDQEMLFSCFPRS